MERTQFPAAQRNVVLQNQSPKPTNFSLENESGFQLALEPTDQATKTAYVASVLVKCASFHFWNPSIYSTRLRKTNLIAKKMERTYFRAAQRAVALRKS